MVAYHCATIRNVIQELGGVIVPVIFNPCVGLVFRWQRSDADDTLPICPV